MSGIIRFTPHTERGRGILDDLERKTGRRPVRSDRTGTREYWLTAESVGVDEFDRVLDEIAPDWRDHLSR